MQWCWITEGATTRPGRQLKWEGACLAYAEFSLSRDCSCLTSPPLLWGMYVGSYLKKKKGPLKLTARSNPLASVGVAQKLKRKGPLSLLFLSNCYHHSYHLYFPCAMPSRKSLHDLINPRHYGSSAIIRILFDECRNWNTECHVACSPSQPIRGRTRVWAKKISALESWLLTLFQHTGFQKLILVNLYKKQSRKAMEIGSFYNEFQIWKDGMEFGSHLRWLACVTEWTSLSPAVGCWVPKSVFALFAQKYNLAGRLSCLANPWVPALIFSVRHNGGYLAFFGFVREK